MLNEKATMVLLVVVLIKKYFYIKMSYFPPYIYSKNKVEVELDLSNFAIKSDLKNATGVDISQFAKKDDLANLKSKVDQLYIAKLSELDADKLKPFPVDLSKLSDMMKNNCNK